MSIYNRNSNIWQSHKRNTGDCTWKSKTINHYLRKFSEVLSDILSIPPAGSLPDISIFMMIEGLWRRAFLPMFNCNAKMRIKTQWWKITRSTRATSLTGRENARIFVQTVAFSFVLTFIIATLCSLPVEIKSLPFLCFFRFIFFLLLLRWLG